MAVHKDDMGAYCATVFFYTDTWGYIPEVGDKARDFDYPKDHPRWHFHWRDWIQRAQDAMARAKGVLV